MQKSQRGVIVVAKSGVIIGRRDIMGYEVKRLLTLNLWFMKKSTFGRVLFFVLNLCDESFDALNDRV